MEKLKSVIDTIISEKSAIDWLIVHDVSKSSPKTDDIEFSFVEGNEREDEPFKNNQGYISLKTTAVINEFEKIVTELSNDFTGNTVALANLFVIISRISYKGEDKATLIKKFKINLEKEACQAVFNLLIKSLNSEYHKFYHSTLKKPERTNEWLDLFHTTQYIHGFSDPILSCLQLVRAERNHKLDFELIRDMKPLLRSVLIGWYGFDLNISKNKLKQLLKNEEELTFLSACLIDDTAPEMTPPDWLSENLIETFIERHWSKIGRQIFVHVFGLSYRNKNQNELYKKLEDLIHTVLFKKLISETDKTKEWISKLEFSDDFIALFAWFSNKKIDYSKIPFSNKSAILDQFIKELHRISKEIPAYLASENSTDPFSSFQLYEAKYQNALSHLLLLSLYSTEGNRKDLTDVCFEFKPLFYGGFRACSLAINFTELMLLIGLSGFNLNDLEKTEFASLRKYMKVIADTVLIPYIHLAEHADEIWNPESKREVFQYNAGHYLVSAFLSIIRKHEITQHYQGFFEKINEVKVAEWPFERS